MFNLKINLSKIKYKKRFWMTQDWPAYLYMIDAFGCLCPKYCRVKVFGYIHAGEGICHRLSKGSNDLKNGPPL